MSTELNNTASVFQADTDACVKNVWKFAWLGEKVDINGSTYSLQQFFRKGMCNLFLNIVN